VQQKTVSPYKKRSGEASPDGIDDLLASAAMADVATSNDPAAEVEVDPDDFMMMADAMFEDDEIAASQQELQPEVEALAAAAAVASAPKSASTEAVKSSSGFAAEIQSDPTISSGSVSQRQNSSSSSSQGKAHRSPFVHPKSTAAQQPSASTSNVQAGAADEMSRENELRQLRAQILHQVRFLAAACPSSKLVWLPECCFPDGCWCLATLCACVYDFKGGYACSLRKISCMLSQSVCSILPFNVFLLVRYLLGRLARVPPFSKIILLAEIKNQFAGDQG
jgi:hypothetical protein